MSHAKRGSSPGQFKTRVNIFMRNYISDHYFFLW